MCSVGDRGCPVGWVRGCYLVPVSTWHLGACAVAGSVDVWYGGVFFV